MMLQDKAVFTVKLLCSANLLLSVVTPLPMYLEYAGGLMPSLAIMRITIQSAHPDFEGERRLPRMQPSRQVPVGWYLTYATRHVQIE